MPPFLSSADVQQLYKAIIAANHLDDGTWLSSLSTLLPAYRAALPRDAASGPGMYSTLQQLNSSGRLVDGTIPIEVVLASLRVLTADSEVDRLAARLLATVEGQAGLGAQPGSVAYVAAGGPEAYTGTRDDLLPFEFLRLGDVAGRAVVKLVVPRFEGKRAADGPIGPLHFLGTGWLVAHDLVVTNYHVIRAREQHEQDPTASELCLQAAATEVQLNYDRHDVAPARTEVVSLVAYGVACDYAILQVSPLATWPTPLRVRRGRPSVPAEGCALNIIQHPGGLPKRIAVRSNLLKESGPRELQYFGDTLGGSSGAPLCNDRWEVVGMHRASGPATGVVIKGKPAAFYNIGIPIETILSDLETSHPDTFAKVRSAILD